MVSAGDLVGSAMLNVLPPWGGQVRDAFLWSKDIDKVLSYNADVLIMNSGSIAPDRVAIKQYLEVQRDVYKFIHDQTLRLARKCKNDQSQPVGATEIAEKLKLPASLEIHESTGGFYGTLNYNSKAVYQNYFGCWDGSAATLNPLPPFEEATRYVAAMGGRRLTYVKATDAFNEADYRWAATLLNHLLITDPTDLDALQLQTLTFRQLASASESTVWRNIYLSAIMVMWDLYSPCGGSDNHFITSQSMMNSLEYLATFVDPDVADGKEIVAQFNFTDIGETYSLYLKHSVLHAKEGPADTPDFKCQGKAHCDVANPSDLFCFTFSLAQYVPYTAALTIVDGVGTPEDINNFFSNFNFNEDQG